jgi:hypothetical protein
MNENVEVRPLELSNHSKRYRKFGYTTPKKKVKRSTLHITIDTDLLTWIDTHIGSRSKTIERALCEFKSRENEAHKNV